MSTLLSIKTGACPEDCAYCPQSVRYETGLERESLVPLDEVRTSAQAAKDAGATRFCMGAAWRSPKKKDVEAVAAMIREVRALGMETCARSACSRPIRRMSSRTRASTTTTTTWTPSPEFYGEIITTRTYQDRLDTLAAVRDAGLNVCCGGIVGMGETTRDRASMLATLANLPQHPESVPSTSSCACRARRSRARGRGSLRIRAHDRRRARRDAKAFVRLSAGRETMADELQALCFPRRRELDLLRREVADHGQSRRRSRSRAAHASRHRAAGAAAVAAAQAGEAADACPRTRLLALA
jgi:biotin synthase